MDNRDLTKSEEKNCGVITAPVNKIIPFSSVDGPGNRTSVFLQACNFNCRYCHNPETREKCVSCGTCVSQCPAGALTMKDGKVEYDISKCVMCDTCIKVCPHDASPRIRDLTPEQLLEQVKKQMPYIRGVTFSGGECTLYPEFLMEAAKLIRAEGLTVLLDSNGSYDFSADGGALADAVDGVMLDVKAWTREDHLAVTDCDNDMVLSNMKYLAERGKLFEVRTVVVPGLFDAEKTVRETSAFLKPYQEKAPIRYKIIAYRPMGVREEYRVFPVPAKEELEALADIARNNNCDVIII